MSEPQAEYITETDAPPKRLRCRECLAELPLERRITDYRVRLFFLSLDGPVRIKGRFSIPCPACGKWRDFIAVY